MNYEKLLKLVNEEINNNNYQKAKHLLIEAIKINNNSFELVYNLGLVNKYLGNIEEAINCFEKSTKINSNFSPPYTTLGSIYTELGKEDLALKNYFKAIEIDPNNFIAHYNLGNFYFLYGDINKAEKYFNLSINLNKNNINPYNNLFQLYDRSNNLEKLEEILNKTKKVFGLNTFTKFLEGIFQYRKKNYKVSSEILEKLELDEKDISRNILRANILAKNYDYLKIYEKAFQFYQESNFILEKAYLQKVNKNRYINLIDKRLNFFSQKDLTISQNKNNNLKNDLVFLIGFPRSGTTLLDTILRTHKLVKVLEEKPLVDKIILEMQKSLNGDFTNLENFNLEKINDLQKVYFEERDKFIKVKQNEIFVDKLPLNIIYIAEILKIFPSAKFILALRHPKDAVLSCFMQPFIPNDAMSNFLNLKDTVAFYDLVMKLWVSYQNKLKLNVHVIKYEDVVNNFDKSLQNLLNFLQLEWSEDLRNFYSTADKKRLINTPSYNQVNRPIYKESIGRWRNYENKFYGLENILNKWVNYFEY